MGRVGIDLFEIRNQFCMLACYKKFTSYNCNSMKSLKKIQDILGKEIEWIIL